MTMDADLLRAFDSSSPEGLYFWDRWVSWMRGPERARTPEQQWRRDAAERVHLERERANVQGG